MRDEELLSMTAAAARKGVPTDDVRNAIESGELPAAQRGGAWLLRPDEVDRWVAHAKTAAGDDYTAAEANEAFHGTARA